MKTTKIGNNLRNLVLSQKDTQVIGKNNCSYFGETYKYEPMSTKERTGIVDKIIALIDGFPRNDKKN